MGRPKGSKNKPKEYKPGERPPGRPKKDREKQAAEIAEMNSIRDKRMVELSQQRRIELGAEIMAKEQTAMELETTYSEYKAARAKWKVDKEKLRTHNQYITAIATLPTIDSLDPVQVRERMALYCEIASAAGQRLVFETAALALGITRKMLANRIYGLQRLSQENQQAYAYIRTLLDAAIAEYAHSGEANAIATIFFAKNNQRYSNDDPGHMVDDIDDNVEQTNEEIAKKYGDLPV